MKQLQEMLKPYFSEGQKDYDITAVLKYIDRLNTDFYFTETERYEDSIRVYTEDFYEEGKITKFGDNLGWIPLTPLHLYTEQEEISLLELLQKLGNKN